MESLFVYNRLTRSMNGFLGCKHTLLPCTKLFSHQYLKDLLCRADLNQFITQSVLILEIAVTQVWDLALGPLELNEVHMGPLLKPFKVPLAGIPSLKHISCTPQLGAI